MDTTVLRKAGLTESQAKGYLALIEHGALSPADLAEKTGETRTNAYAIADKLVALGLATKKDGKPATYSPAHPSALETLAEKRRKVVQQNEQVVKQNMKSILDYFYEYQSTPGVEVYYGGEGIEKIRAQTIQDKDELLFVRSAGDRIYDGTKLKEFIAQRVKAGIPAKSIAPAPDSTTRSRQQLDEWLLDRTLIPGGLYDAPVEIDIFGDKVAFIDFDNDSMSTTITSQNIALAMRQLFLMAKHFADELYDQAQLLEQTGQHERPHEDE